MAVSRLYYQNLISQANFAGFQTAGGAVALAAATPGKVFSYNEGSAVAAVRLNPTTGWTAPTAKNFVAEVHSSSDGTFPNTRWRWSNTGDGTWNQQNLTPVDGAWVPLSDGMEFQLTSSGSPPQFALADTWEWRPSVPYGIVKAMDYKRDTEYRSGTIPSNGTLRVGWDLQVARQPGLLVLDDHNLPSNATVTLFAHPTTLFTETGGFSQVIPWQANRLAALVTSSAFRFWWIRVAFVSAPTLGYLRVSEFSLSTGVTFRKCPRAGTSTDLTFLGTIDVTDTATRGPSPRVYVSAMPQYTWGRVRRALSDDGGKLEAALAYARTHASYTYPPFYFIPDEGVLSEIEYNSWVGNGLQRQHAVADLFDYSVSWASVIRTVAS